MNNELGIRVKKITKKGSVVIIEKNYGTIKVDKDIYEKMIRENYKIYISKCCYRKMIFLSDGTKITRLPDFVFGVEDLLKNYIFYDYKNNNFFDCTRNNIIIKNRWQRESHDKYKNVFPSKRINNKIKYVARLYLPVFGNVTLGTFAEEIRAAQEVDAAYRYCKINGTQNIKEKVNLTNKAKQKLDDALKSCSDIKKIINKVNAVCR